MGKVELTLKEYNDLITATADALNDKLSLKKEIMRLEQKNTELVAKYIDSKVYVWTHKFDKEIEITGENLNEYINEGIWDYEKFDKKEVLQAVRWLRNEKFN